MTHRPRGYRAGFALPVAAFTLVVLTLLTALLFAESVQEALEAHAAITYVRAQAAAESAVADLFSIPVDPAFLALSRGSALDTQLAARGDTVALTVQSLGGGLARAVAVARAWSGGVRSDASVVVLMRLARDSTVAGPVVRFRRLPGSWWGTIP